MELQEKADVVAKQAEGRLKFMLSAVLPAESLERLSIDVAAEQVAEGFYYTLQAAKTDGVVIEVHSVPASWWDACKAAFSNYLPAWLARRVTVYTIELPCWVRVNL